MLLAQVISQCSEKFTCDNLRYNLMKLTRIAPKGEHAHRVMPVKFAKLLRNVGLNIRHPKYIAW